MVKHKIIISSLICFLILTISVSAAPSNHKIYKEHIQQDIRDVNRYVLAEYITMEGCGYCKYAHAALKNIYSEQEYPLIYMSFVGDANIHATHRGNEYNVQGVPDVFFDGGYRVELGSGNVEDAQAAYEQHISDCLERPVANVNTTIAVDWLGDATMSISVAVQNDEPETYYGTLRVYVCEIISSMNWKDSGGHLYTFPFLNYAINDDIHINSGGIWEDTVEWNGNEHDDGFGHTFGSIEPENTIVFAVVFNEERHQGYANPPNGWPFDAYYVDSIASSTPELISDPPTTPTISGPQSGKAGVEYSYTIRSIDGEGDDIYYQIDWGDNSLLRWYGPYPSNTDVEFSHIWNDKDTYEVTVKAKDIYDAKSDISDPYYVEIGSAEIVLSEISGGLMVVQASVMNNRSTPLTDIEWTMQVTGGILNLIDVSTTEVIEVLQSGDFRRIQTDKPLLGLGDIAINITIHTTNPPILFEQSFSGKIFGPFVILN